MMDRAHESGRRRSDAAGWAGLWGRVVPRPLTFSGDKTERRMVLLQWYIMPLVLAGSLAPLSASDHASAYVIWAALVMVAHLTVYAVIGRMSRLRSDVRDALLTAADLTMATVVFDLTIERPGFAQVLLFCAVALVATRYSPYRALGITSLVALLIGLTTFSSLIFRDRPAVSAVVGEIIALYALTYLVGLLAQAEKAVSVAAAENARLAETVLRRNRELGALNGLARMLNASDTAHDVLNAGIGGIADALDLHHCRAFLVKRGETILSAMAARDTSPVADGEATNAFRHHEATCAVALGRTKITPLHPPHDLLSSRPALCVSVPLIARGVTVAVIQGDMPAVTNVASEAFLETFEIFCDELAVALENVHLRGEAHRTAILSEKNRIAQELHDTVLQLLFTIGLRLQWSLDRLAPESELNAPLLDVRGLTARAGSELRGAIFTLSSDIAEVGLLAAVQRLVDEQARRADWTARVVAGDVSAHLPVLVQNAAHRVVREALMNAYKHAHASDVMVSLRETSTTLTVVVQDNGVGIPQEKLIAFRDAPDHFGLRTIAEQVERLGGVLSIYHNEDEPGTAVKAVIPLHEAVVDTAPPSLPPRLATGERGVRV